MSKVLRNTSAEEWSSEYADVVELEILMQLRSLLALSKECLQHPPLVRTWQSELPLLTQSKLRQPTCGLHHAIIIQSTHWLRWSRVSHSYELVCNLQQGVQWPWVIEIVMDRFSSTRSGWDLCCSYLSIPGDAVDMHALHVDGLDLDLVGQTKDPTL